MGSSERRERVARAGFEAFGTGDGSAILEILAEDVEIFASPELANGGTFHGHDGYLRWSEPWIDVWDELDLQVEEMTPVGERHIVVAVHQTGQGRAGIEVSMEVAFLFEIADDQVGYLALHPGREEALRSAREREGLV